MITIEGEPHLFCDLGWVKSKARWCIGGVNISCQKLKQIRVMILDFIYKCQRKWMRNEYYATMHCQKWKVGDIWRNKDSREAYIGKMQQNVTQGRHLWTAGFRVWTAQHWKKLFVKSPLVVALEKWKSRRMATQTSLAMAGARVAGIPPVNVPGLINPPVRKKGFIGAISSSGWFLHFSLNKLLTQESFNLVPLYNGWQKKATTKRRNFVFFQFIFWLNWAVQSEKVWVCWKFHKIIPF